jgi:hypothetical protein
LIDPAFTVGFQRRRDRQVGAAAFALQDEFADPELGSVRGDVLYCGSTVVQAGWEGVVAGCSVSIPEIDEDGYEALLGNRLDPAAVGFDSCWD